MLFKDHEIDTADPKKGKSGKLTTATTSAPENLFIGKRYQKVSEVLGDPIAHNTATHYVSAGEWSMHDLLFLLLKQTGPAVVYLASWSITADPCQRLVKAIQAGHITALHCLFDWRVKVRCPEAAAIMKQQAAAVHTTNSHAKVTVIQNATWNISIVGSANYTNNPRIEAGVITENPTVAQFHRHWIQEEINRSDPFEFKAK